MEYQLFTFRIGGYFQLENADSSLLESDGGIFLDSSFAAHAGILHMELFQQKLFLQ